MSQHAWRPFIDAIGSPVPVAGPKADFWVLVSLNSFEYPSAADTTLSRLMADLFGAFTVHQWSTGTLAHLSLFAEALSYSPTLDTSLAKLVASVVIQALREANFDDIRAVGVMFGIGVCQALSLIQKRWPGVLECPADLRERVKAFCPIMLLESTVFSSPPLAALTQGDSPEAITVTESQGTRLMITTKSDSDFFFMVNLDMPIIYWVYKKAGRFRHGQAHILEPFRARPTTFPLDKAHKFWWMTNMYA